MAVAVILVGGVISFFAGLLGLVSGAGIVTSVFFWAGTGLTVALLAGLMALAPQRARLAVKA